MYFNHVDCTSNSVININVARHSIFYKHDVYTCISFYPLKQKKRDTIFTALPKPWYKNSSN